MLSIAFLKALLTKTVIVKTIRDLITRENKVLLLLTMKLHCTRVAQ